MHMETTKQKLASTFEAMKGTFGYTNVMQTPTIEKIVVSVGTGRVQDKHREALIVDRLSLITGQKPSPRPAKQSIASFKLREGEIIGHQVTIRGARMIHFIDKLIHIAIPQTRDFRGLKPTAIDEMGNITIGIKDSTIFPECADDELKDSFSFAVTIVTTAKTKAEAEAFLRHIGLPLQKAE